MIRTYDAKDVEVTINGVTLKEVVEVEARIESVASHYIYFADAEGNFDLQGPAALAFMRSLECAPRRSDAFHGWHKELYAFFVNRGHERKAAARFVKSLRKGAAKRRGEAGNFSERQGFQRWQRFAPLRATCEHTRRRYA